MNIYIYAHFRTFKKFETLPRFYQIFSRIHSPFLYLILRNLTVIIIGTVSPSKGVS